MKARGGKKRRWVWEIVIPMAQPYRVARRFARFVTAHLGLTAIAQRREIVEASKPARKRERRK